jgi:hypothetical protein
MVHFMNAGTAAEILTLSTDETKSKIVSAVYSLIRADNPSITEGAVSKALFSGCAIVSTVSNVLRVPTKEDVAARVQATNDKKKPRLNGVGERQSIAKILNSDERLEKGAEYDEAKSAESKVKEVKEVEKLERRRVEFPLLVRCKALSLTPVVPHSKAGQLYSLLKAELVALCVKLGLEADCKKVTKKKHSSLNRTELGDYLLTKLNDTGHIGIAIETPLNAAGVVPSTFPMILPPPEILAAIPVALEADIGTIFESWEEVNEYLHSHYGFGVEIEDTVPSRADVIGLREFYNNGSDEDKFMLDSSWYKRSQFKFDTQ